MSDEKPFARIVREGGVKRMYVGPQYIGDATEHPDSGIVAIGFINNAFEQAVAQRVARLHGALQAIIEAIEPDGAEVTARMAAHAQAIANDALDSNGPEYVSGDVACGLAWDCGAARAHLEGSWGVLLEEMQQAGADGAAAVAQALGVKLGLMRPDVRWLADIPGDDELLAEVKRRGLTAMIVAAGMRGAAAAQELTDPATARALRSLGVRLAQHAAERRFHAFRPALYAQGPDECSECGLPRDSDAHASF